MLYIIHYILYYTYPNCLPFSQDTNQLLEKVANATKTLVLLKPAIEKAKIALVSYYESNVVTLGVERALKAGEAYFLFRIIRSNWL